MMRFLFFIFLVNLVADASVIKWEPIHLPKTEQSPFKWVFHNDLAGNRLLAGSATAGLFASKDGGRSWSRVDDGSFLGKLGGLNPTAHSFTSDRNGTYYVITQAGIWESKNQAVTWKPIDLAANLYGYPHRIWKWGKEIYLQTVSPDDKYFLWHSSTDWKVLKQVSFAIATNIGVESWGVGGSIVCGLNEKKMTCSRDNGLNWSNVSLPEPRHPANSDREFLEIGSQNEIYLHLSTGDFISLDTGETFQPLTWSLGDSLYSANVFPMYSLEGNSEARNVAILEKNGAIQNFPGPVKKEFRLKAFDTLQHTFVVWSEDGFFKGRFD